MHRKRRNTLFFQRVLDFISTAVSLFARSVLPGVLQGAAPGVLHIPADGFRRHGIRSIHGARYNASPSRDHGPGGNRKRHQPAFRDAGPAAPEADQYSGIATCFNEHRFRMRGSGTGRIVCILPSRDALRPEQLAKLDRRKRNGSVERNRAGGGLDPHGGDQQAFRTFGRIFFGAVDAAEPSRIRGIADQDQ